MGVTGLWQILHPCARPIKLETLNRKRLAVDASIWIYQFLKAVRDKEGNALRNSHVVGFFRRICKLLFFGIKPVFVFDGGAPALKRHTVNERKRRREGRRDDAIRTAGKLLAVQMQRRAEEDEARRKEDRDRRPTPEEIALPENLIYADENLMGQQERQQNRRFRKKDAYHLPDLDVSMNEMGGPNDPRVMSLEELQTYAKQFEAGEDINVYDFSKIDYDSPFFTSLPASDRYNILNAARLRSRLRMGHSKEQLDSMFPDRMAFSKFQIDRVRERNELTQRLMHINEGGDALFDGGGRIAGEKGREYVLVKNDGVEGGWALGVISDEGTKQETAIDIDAPEPVARPDDREAMDEDDFEDVPIEGLNRLPRLQRRSGNDEGPSTVNRNKPHKRRRPAVQRSRITEDPDSLFVTEEPIRDETDEEWEDVNGDTALFDEDPTDAIDDENLQRAIAMSLEGDEKHASESAHESQHLQNSSDEEDLLEVFQQSIVPEARPVPKGSGRAIANLVNRRAFDAAPESREVTSFGVPALKSDEDQADEDTMDLQVALAESRRTKSKASPLSRKVPSVPRAADSVTKPAKQVGFAGPLPFEKLDLGSSLLGRKKMQARAAENQGGFENPDLAEPKKRKNDEPLPPWFAGNLEEDIKKQRALENEDRERAREFDKQFQFETKDGPSLRRRNIDEIIDLDAEDDSHRPSGFQQGEVIDLESVASEEKEASRRTSKLSPATSLGERTNEVSAEPSISNPRSSDIDPSIPFQDDDEDEAARTSEDRSAPSRERQVESDTVDNSQDEETIPWSDSGSESVMDGQNETRTSRSISVNGARLQVTTSRSPSAEFEDVNIPDQPMSLHAESRTSPRHSRDFDDEPRTAPGLVHQESYVDDEQAEFDDMSDPEEEELLRQLTLEAEEHARFASTLNHKTQAENIADYEKELKQLRTQQKKDRRDADEVTHIMIQECQQLLRLFGLPYVTAPMEAEAQCAELVRLGLVDGIVTDDSDCFLFGGTRVYKNMFNQAKFVECYLTTDLEKEFDLTREKLIQVAHLLGSDYTEGLPGVGPVTALEILGEFHTLEDFKTWWNAVQMNLVSKSEDSGKPFRKKFRKNATKLFLPPSFPDVRVDRAYQSPEVDADPEPFQWGVPDLDALRNFLMATIGWSQERTDEVLVPVIKDMNRRVDEGTQSNITAFFDGSVGIGAAGARSGARGEAFAPRKRVAESSKRMGSALSRMAERAKVGKGDTRDDVREPLPGNADTVDDQIGEEASGNVKTAARSKRATSITSGGESGESEFEAPRKRRKGPRKSTGRRKKV